MSTSGNDAGAAQWLTTLASESAQTKVELPDIVNVLIEELLRRRYELPPLAALLRIATQARSEIHETIYRAITDGLDDSLIARIDALFVVHAGKSGWDELKCEPKTASCTRDCELPQAVLRWPFSLAAEHEARS
jgi:hypothetical protein